MTTPASLLYPLKLDVVGFKEDEYDYHFRVELAEPTCCQACGAAEGRVMNYDLEDAATDYGVPISTVMRLIEMGEL